jgi:capsule polysaccharide export protein KpsE/RkpR
MRYVYNPSESSTRTFSFDEKSARDRVRAAQDHIASCNLKLSQLQEKLSLKSSEGASQDEIRKLSSEVLVSQIRCEIAEVKLERVEAMNEFDRRLQSLMDRIKSISNR